MNSADPHAQVPCIVIWREVCVYGYIYIYMYNIYVQGHIHIYIYIYLYMGTYIYVYKCVCGSMYICVFVDMSVLTE